MAVAIISDIHANLEALDAVAEDIERMDKLCGITEVHCLGDIVNYGPNPAECIKRVRALCDVVLRGNHDDAVATLNRPMLRKNFHDTQRAGVFWTRRQLSREDLDYLAGLPHQHLVDGVAEVHGTLCSAPAPGDIVYTGNPAKDLEYATFTRYCHIRKEEDAPNLFRCFNSLRELDKRVCFVGHVQKAEGYFQRDGEPRIAQINLGMKGWSKSLKARELLDPNPKKLPQFGELGVTPWPGTVSVEVRLQKDCRYIFDVGSVGQPRDFDCRASYGIYDGERFILRRIPYDFEKTAKKINAVVALKEKHSLDPWFGERLAQGK